MGNTGGVRKYDVQCHKHIYQGSAVQWFAGGQQLPAPKGGWSNIGHGEVSRNRQGDSLYQEGVGWLSVFNGSDYLITF